MSCILPGIDTPFCTAVVHSVYIGFQQLIRVFGKSLLFHPNLYTLHVTNFYQKLFRY